MIANRSKSVTALLTCGVVCGSGLLAHCGGGASNNDHAEADATASADGEPSNDGGELDATIDSLGDTAVPFDATGNADHEPADGPADVGNAPEGAPGDAAGLDGEGDALDSGAEAAPTFDGGGDGASVLDGEADALDGGADGAEGEAGMVEAGGIPCDVDAQADAQTCTGAATAACCSGFCVDTALDPRNCGHCGVACTTSQFCTGVQCDDAVVANVCGNPAATVVLDPYAADNEAGVVIGAALAMYCAPPTKIAVLAQDDGGVVDPTTGRPITGVGNTFITGGGSFGQRGLAYLENAGLAPLYPYTSGDEYDVIERSTGTSVISTTFSALTAQHDYFYVQMAVEPQSGTLCFSGVGLLGPGTLAAAYYLSAEMVPNRANYTAAWYVYEWTDSNNDSIADQGDTFTQMSSGM